MKSVRKEDYCNVRECARARVSFSTGPELRPCFSSVCECEEEKYIYIYNVRKILMATA